MRQEGAIKREGHGLLLFSKKILGPPQAANREPFEAQSLKNSEDFHGVCSKLSDSSFKVSEAYLIKVKKKIV
ncbi:hypothetical protein IEQ34_000230 [Dendrobium chrysotoxum]|uniref:Uncharacterized protein n=1 Tax=Dendrobium chrysotoxum TaxID=161865 RepID=A0AAV7HS60_DENCH|nr:hypothetical protein IEQ34_000230 [Dendrobium chrysotoxum]